MWLIHLSPSFKNCLTSTIFATNRSLKKLFQVSNENCMLAKFMYFWLYKDLYKQHSCTNRKFGFQHLNADTHSLAKMEVFIFATLLKRLKQLVPKSAHPFWCKFLKPMLAFKVFIRNLHFWRKWFSFFFCSIIVDLFSSLLIIV